MIKSVEYTNMTLHKDTTREIHRRTFSADFISYVNHVAHPIHVMTEYISHQSRLFLHVQLNVHRKRPAVLTWRTSCPIS